MFGALTFEGEIVKCLQLHSYSSTAPGDERPCAISDMTITEEDEIILCDKDNKRVKVSSAGSYPPPQKKILFVQPGKK